MANSKSNIYPIQLQGAELNLNKYDAEIKQYSGFNKNNSPFVGGCLSNLFRKDEIIEGNGSNVFIDKNGDVWGVDEYGFTKNGVGFGERSATPLEFWKLEEKNIPDDNIFFYYNDNAYVTKKQYNNGFIYTVYINGVTYQFTSTAFFISFDIEYINTWGIWAVAWKQYYYEDNNNRARVVVEAITLDNQGDAFLPLYMNNSDDTRFYVSFNANWLNFSDICILNGQRWCICVNDCANLLSSGESDNGFSSAYVYKCYVKDYSTLSMYVQSSVTEFSGSAIYRNFNNWHFTKNGAYFFPIAVFNADSDWSNGYKIPTKVSVESGTGAYIFIEEEFDKVTLYAYNNTVRPIHFSKPEIGKTVLKRFGALYTINNFDTTKRAILGKCDFLTEAVSMKKVGYTYSSLVGFDTGGLINGSVLVNNGYVSGIALPGGLILATEWNSINKDFIFFSNHFGDANNIEDNYVVFKDSGSNKWYKLCRTEEKIIRNLNGQLVINCNRLNNAVRLNDEKVLTFAPAWNNRFPFCNNYRINENTDNSKYFSSTINEYSLADNASILLNPIPVANAALPFINTEQLIGKQYDFKGINFYIGNDATDCKYVFSAINDKTLAKANLFLDENLVENITLTSYEGFAFPVDSNGNVTYSPSLFCEIFSNFGNDVFIKFGNDVYQLSKSDNAAIMSFYLGTLVENLEAVFILQGQYYGVINKQIFSIQFYNGVVANTTSIVSVEGLQYCGSTPYEALFYSATNKCLYSFTGANILQSKQFVDKINVVKSYKYNPATQSIFLLTDIGVLVYSLFGIYCIDMPEAENMFLLNNGVVLCDNEGHYRYIRYYKEDADTDYIKENIKLETCFYGMNDQTVTINDCLYLRLFSEDHEEGEVRIASSVISLEGRVTEETVYHFTANDWDKMTHTIYMRYQPKNQRGLGISFSVDSPFKIASMSVGSQPDAILIDKVSKGAINAPHNNNSSITNW